MKSDSGGEKKRPEKELFRTLISKLEKAGLPRHADATGWLLTGEALAEAALAMTTGSGNATKKNQKRRFRTLVSRLEKEAGLPRHADATGYMLTKEARVEAGLDDYDVAAVVEEYRTKKNDDPLTSLDFGDTLPRAKPASGKRTEIDCRVQASSCFRGRVWSFTIRRGGKRKTPKRLSLRQWIKALKASGWESGFKPSVLHAFEDGPPALASIDELSESLLEMFGLNDLTSRPSGLLLITGETNCSKSLITRGIIYKHLILNDVPADKRNPHLVTYEDPIEEWFFDGERLQQAPFTKGRRIDYTPRQKGQDCEGLKECTQAALRQTPAVFFAGEIREPEDLAEAVYFGGTGHLIIATAHAGSVVEAADKILSALKVSNPFQRAVHVPKILGIVHLRKMDVEFEVKGIENSLKTSMVVPSIYRRCSQGMQSFIADGLTALVPFCPRDKDGEGGYKPHGSLGRQYMLKRILGRSPRAGLLKGDYKCEEVWTHHWQAIRAYHANPRNPDKSPIRPPDTKDDSRNQSASEGGELKINLKYTPLWMQCVQDDLKGMR